MVSTMVQNTAFLCVAIVVTLVARVECTRLLLDEVKADLFSDKIDTPDGEYNYNKNNDNVDTTRSADDTFSFGDSSQFSYSVPSPPYQYEPFSDNSFALDTPDMFSNADNIPNAGSTSGFLYSDAPPSPAYDSTIFYSTNSDDSHAPPSPSYQYDATSSDPSQVALTDMDSFSSSRTEDDQMDTYQDSNKSSEPSPGLNDVKTNTVLALDSTTGSVEPARFADATMTSKEEPTFQDDDTTNP